MIVDEKRQYIIIHKHGEKARTLRPPLVAGGVAQMLEEKYAEFPQARIEVLTVEIEKSENDKYHLYPSGIELYPTLMDGREYLKKSVK